MDVPEDFGENFENVDIENTGLDVSENEIDNGVDVSKNDIDNGSDNPKANEKLRLCQNDPEIGCKFGCR